MIGFGSRVNCRRCYERTHRPLKGYYGILEKYWEVVPCHIEGGIYLGERSLSNGQIDVTGDAIVFERKSGFKAALVAPDGHRNPVYVPLDAVVEVGLF